MKRNIVISIILVFIILLLSFIGVIIYDKIKYPIKYKEEIELASEEFGVENYVIASIINVESGFDKNSISNKGAVGLMQIMPSTGEWLIKKLISNQGYKVADDDFSVNLINSNKDTSELLDVSTNIRLGTYYFSYLLDKFSNFDVAICAYNAGEGRVNSWLADSNYSSDGKTLKKIPYNETRNYLKKVKLNLQIYQKKF